MEWKIYVLRTIFFNYKQFDENVWECSAINRFSLILGYNNTYNFFTSLDILTGAENAKKIYIRVLHINLSDL